jgi:hypothetical protein
MNVNVTLLMTMTWAARMALAVVVESPAEGAPLGVDGEGDDEAGPVVSFDTRSWRPLYWCVAAADSWMQNACAASGGLSFCPAGRERNCRPQLANGQFSRK